MLDYLLNLDRAATVAINSWHSPFWDSVMLFVTNKQLMAPVYILLLLMVLLRRKFKVGRKEYYNCWSIVLIIILSSALAAGFADKFGHEVIKPFFQRLRPGYDFYIWDQVRTPDGKGGAWGFVSNHAFNVFSLATVLSCFARRTWFGILAFLTALAVGYSRVYLGRHFLGDVLCGAICGIIIGCICYWLASQVIKFLGRKQVIRQCR